MPTVLRVGPYKFYFYPYDVLHEPPHIHVGRDQDEAKFWLDPVELERNRGFAGHELRKIEDLVREHESELIDAWNDVADQAT